MHRGPSFFYFGMLLIFKDSQGRACPYLVELTDSDKGLRN